MAVSVWISPWIRIRSRIVYAIESSTVARLPPTWLWMLMAVTISSTSSEATRRDRLFSAGCRARPRLISRTTRSNSSEMGGRASRVTSSTPWRNEEPARSELASRVIVSGSCAPNCLSRLPCRYLR